MKNYFASKTLIALAVAIAAAAGYENQINAQPIPPPANGSALPPSITPGTPAAEVVKLAQAGVDVGVIQNYIAGCPGAFNLNADQIIALTDAGVSSDMVNAMIAHDKNLSVAVAPPVASPAPVDNPNSAPPTTEMTVNEFNDTLTPYGQWVEVEGYGRCWRPTTVIYDSTWQPYCDRGHWVYTDCGWYWDSDYAWGVTFHYGRWFHHDRFGWCWWPDVVWAPSWVTWRSCDDYCGWAPLPPFTVYQPGIGFFYRGASVSVGFDFGLGASCFTFISINHFCESHPRYYCAPAVQVTAIYNRTTVINNYGSNNRTIVNNGVSVTTIGAATHHPIQPVQVGSMLNASRHGWRGGDANPGGQRFGANSSAGATVPNAGGAGLHREPTLPNNNGSQHDYPANSGAGAGTGSGRHPSFTPSAPAPHSSESINPGHAQPNQNQNPPTPGKHQDQHQSGYNWRSVDNPQAQTTPAPAVNQAHNNWPASGTDRWQTRETTRVSPSPVAAPAANFTSYAGERVQRTEPRQNYVAAAPRSIAPAAPAGSANAYGQASGNSDKSQNWANRNH